VCRTAGARAGIQAGFHRDETDEGGARHYQHPLEKGCRARALAMVRSISPQVPH
jgi:hypothetical protein